MLQAAILGSDLILAALPAEPVQVIHACNALGFDVVVPASWGDELIAGNVLDQLAERPRSTAIMCSCPHARRRLLAPGGELSPFMVQTVPPPVAAARYLRAVYDGAALNITYIGACPGADDASIAERMSPAEFLELCVKRGVFLNDQPRVFESRIPVDRRRFHSLPGGLPTADAIRAVHPGTDVLSMDPDGLAFDVAQCVVSGRPALLDLAPAVGCACSGFIGETAWSEGRDALMTLEPPRSTSAVIDTRVAVELETPEPTPAYPAFEESVPLSVVFDADVSRQHQSFFDDEVRRSRPAGAAPGARSPVTRDDATLVHPAARASAQPQLEVRRSSASTRMELPAEPHGESAASTHPGAVAQPASGQSNQPAAPANLTAAAAPARSPVLGTSVRANGTPTGTPAIRTPAGPLPRAYLMLKRISSDSSRHRVVSGSRERPPSGSVEPASPSPSAAHDGRSHLQDGGAPSSREAASGERPVVKPGGVENRNPVDTVLDLLSKAIRDVM